MVLVATLALAGCQQNEGNDTPKAESEELLPASEVKNPNSLQEDAPKGYPEITFDTLHYDFGTIQQGQVVRYDFRFKNTGDGNLLITNVKPSCGCTVASYPKAPIEPGYGGEIPVEYNSRGRKGKFSKTVQVMANTSPNITTLTIEGFVETN